MNRLLLTSACLASLWLSSGTAQAQYGLGQYRPANRARLSPYLNLTRGGDQAANYYLGVIPEQDRRYNDSLFSGQIRQLEQRRGIEPPRLADDLIPPVPVAGKPPGSRTSESYFRQDHLSSHGTHRAPRHR
jgi:hypothetical protein